MATVKLKRPVFRHSSLRLDQRDWQRCQQLIERLTLKLGEPISLTKVLRMSVRRGLDALEREYGK